MKRKTGITLTIFSLILVVLYWFFLGGIRQVYPESHPRSAQKISFAERLAAPTISAPPAKLLAGPNCKQPEKILASPHPIDVNYAEQNTTLERDIVSDPSRFIEKAQTDSKVQVGIFKIAASCHPGLIYPGSPQKELTGCPNASVLQKLQPLELLKKAAESGNVEAQLMYATNAPEISRYLRRQNSSDSYITAVEILKNAERFGNSAAQAGYVPAYRLMSRAYLNGTFGVRDMEKAYAYALPLSLLNNEDDSKEIAKLSRQLDSKTQETARVMAFGCDTKQSFGKEGEVFNNPFVALPT